MKGNSRHPSVPPPPPAPQSPKATAKYTNKDGSKFITVPKGSTPADSAQPSPTTSGANAASGPQSASNSLSQGHGQGQVEGQVQPVNKKKAKRRQKAAAKAAATQGSTNSAPPNGIPSPSPSNAQQSTEADHYDSHDEHPEDARNSNIHENGFAQGASTSSKKSKRKKKKGNAGQNAAETPNSPHHDAFVSAPHMSQQQRSGISKEKIWNTSSQEERERIKEFWLGLSEGERKNLVKVEKNAVLKKMKEQQKHTCSCTVCGRKRTAIEEELEGLYDAYYLELEQYANHPNQGEAPPMLGRRTSFSSMTGMHSRGLPTNFSSHHQPSHGQIIDHGAEDDEEDDVEEEYSEDEQEEDDDYSDDERSEELHRSDYPADFLNFGNSLTVQGGILTVADDLLKNDGKKFIEMMEQLAERRMAREEDAREQFSSPFPHSNGDRNAHFHAGADDEVDDDDDEYDDDYEDEDEDEEDGYDSEVEEETMTEEQRMEEGRRMFQIFAARMFEQRVLTAYREKVAGERQRMLIEEIDDEQRRTQEKQIKKQREAQKKKERQARKKEQQAEEKARREEERLAEEKAKKAEEARQKELKRQREEEKRRQKEAQRKAEEEERKRKEAERQRRNHEREENERKAREAKEREKKAREEARLKEKEAREQREREAREQKEQQEREKKEREAKAKAEMEAAKAAKEKSKQENRAAQKAASLAKAAPPAPITLPNRPAQPAQPAQTSVPAAAVPAIPQQPAAYASPVIPVATPAFPIAPALGHSRQAHQQEGANTSSGSSPQPGSTASQNVSPHTLTPVHTSPGPMKPPSKSGVAVGGTQGGGVRIPSPAPSTSVNPGLKSVQSQPNPFAGPSMNMPFQPAPQPPPGFSNHMQPQYPPFFNPANSFNRVAPGMMAAPPGFPTPLGGRAMPIHPPGFPGPMDSPVSSFASLPGGLSSLLGKDSGSSHARQGSGSFDAGHVGSSGQPISRPTPIGRPASVVHGQRRSPDSSMDGNDKAEEVHLGSSALLEDDTPQDFSARPHFGLLGTSAPGVRTAPGFGGGPFGIEPSFPLPHQNNPWNPAPPLQHNPFVPTPPGFPSSSHHGPWSQAAPPGIMGRNPSIVERSAPWSVTLRKALCSVCEELGAGSSSGYDGFIPLGEIMVRMKHMTGNEKEVLDICDTEGNPSNGGGSFIVRNLSSSGGAPLIRYIPDDDASRASFRPMKHPGDIGSPIVGSGSFNVRS